MTKDEERGREDEGGKGIEAKDAEKQKISRPSYTVPHIHALQASM